MGRYNLRSFRVGFLILIMAVIFINPPPVYAATFTVNSIGDVDNGSCNITHCSLREAVNLANFNPGPDVIEFNIPGAGPHIIVLDSPLFLEDDGTTIDGTTEPDYAGAPVIVLEPSDPTVANIGLIITSNDNVVRGLSIVGFNHPTSAISAGILIGSEGGAPSAGGTGNLIEENYIGFYPSGTVNGNKRGIRIGTTNPQTILNNVISGNNIGLDLGTGGHAIHGNLIGLDPTGTTALMNWNGISISGFNLSGTNIYINYGTEPIVIGGGIAQRNVISGNATGIVLGNASDVIIQNNYIGTDITGTVAVGNIVGIQLYGSTGNIIGEGNIISGNTSAGVFLLTGSSGNQVINNTIGLDINGNPLGNGTYGVYVRGDNNQIGGPGQGNVISANNFFGITISNCSNTQVIENIIGENSNGLPAGNGGAGVTINEGDNILISNNIIAHNHDMGIHVWGSTNTLISGNEIYLNWDHGVNIFSGTQNTISQNSIYTNFGLGINLMVINSDGGWESPPYVTLNDPGDTDSGANTLLNYPEFTSITSSLAEGTACPGCIVEIFLPDGDASGHGEGEVFIASGVATGGNFSIDISGVDLGTCPEITATATDPNGNTSEFSPNTLPLGIICQEFGKVLTPIIILLPGLVLGGWVYYRRRKPGPAAGGFLGGILIGVLILFLWQGFPTKKPTSSGGEDLKPSPTIFEPVEPEKDTPFPTDTPTPTPQVLVCEGILGVFVIDEGQIRINVKVIGAKGQFDAKLNDNEIICQTYEEYPDTLFCDGPRPTPGTWATISIFNSEGIVFCEETFSAPSREAGEDTCSPPAGGCGNPKQGYYWDNIACKCKQCPAGGVYDPDQGKCVKP